jgi:hypothetical protein
MADSALSIKPASNRNRHKFSEFIRFFLHGVVESPINWPPVSATLAMATIGSRAGRLLGLNSERDSIITRSETGFTHQIGDQFFLNLDSVKEKSVNYKAMSMSLAI